MDVSNLTPLPLVAIRGRICNADADGKVPTLRGMRSCGDPFPNVGKMFNEYDADFFILARNAFDVMMRRGWHAEKWDDEGNWFVVSEEGDWITSTNANRLVADRCGPPMIHTDPFTALVEADKWYAENVEANPAMTATPSTPAVSAPSPVAPETPEVEVDAWAPE